MVSYGVNSETALIDMDSVYQKAIEHKPKLIICGASAYSRDWDYATLRKIANESGSILMADIAHPAGLIAARQLNDPVPHCHIITSTTHKTLRGPRGGIIVIGHDFENPVNKRDKKGTLLMMSQLINSAVFPGIQGGPLEHVIAAKAVAFREAATESYRNYAKEVIQNAKIFAQSLKDKGFSIVSGGTDNHLFLLDLRSKNITGKDAEQLLIRADITTNKNMIPNDPQKPMITSGIRLGTAALTTRGFKGADFKQVAEWIDYLVNNRTDESKIIETKKCINDYMKQFPLYPEIIN